jgi:hypothetical protein
MGPSARLEWAVRPMYPAGRMSIIRLGMNDRGFHYIEDDLADTWVEDWAAVGVRELEALLAKHAAFLGYLDSVED